MFFLVSEHFTLGQVEITRQRYADMSTAKADVRIRNSRRWVVKHNRFVNARYDLSLIESRIVLLMVSNISRDDATFGIHRIRISDIAEEFNIDNHDLYGKGAEDLADSLLAKQIEVPLENGGWDKYSMMDWAKYRPKEGYLELKFNDSIKELLLQLKNRFTRYGLRWVTQFQSSYSIRIYELLKQYDDIGHRVLEVDALRELLGLENKYNRFYDLKRRVINKAKEEINKYSDILVSYEEIKEGRSTVALRFDIDRNFQYGKREMNSNSTNKQLSLPTGNREDELEEWFYGLPEEEQQQLWEEGKDQALQGASNNDSKWWIEGKIWGYIERKRKEYA